MSRLIKVITCVVAILHMISGMSWASGPSEPPPQVVAKAAILIDSQTGAVLYNKEMDRQMAPASTTKILTSLIALEKGDLKQKIKTSKKAIQETGSSIWLLEGEEMTLEDLVYSVLLNSANDAAMVLAETIGGSKEGFAKLMNEKARSVGAKNSNFLNPNGLPEAGHCTSAYDLAMITKAAMANPKFREIVQTKVRDIPRSQPTALKRLINHNKLLWRYDGANGVKTGYTVEAQQCLVASAKRGDREFIAAVLGSQGQNVWTDVSNLLDYGFDNYKTVSIIGAGKKVETMEIAKGEQALRVVTGEKLDWTTLLADNRKPQQKVRLDQGLEAPVEKGQQVGFMIYQVEGKEIGRVKLVAGNAVAKKKPPVVSYVGTGAVVLAIGLFLAANYLAWKRRQQMRKIIRRTRWRD